MGVLLLLRADGCTHIDISFGASPRRPSAATMDFEEHIPLSEHTTFKIGGLARLSCAEKYPFL